MVVTVDLGGEELTFLLGSREVSDASLDVYSEKSPLGAAINGHKAGDSTSYQAPNGKQVTVKVLQAKPYAV
jgi:transcription elongation factor GreA